MKNISDINEKKDFIENDLLAWLFSGLKLFIYVFILLLLINGTCYLGGLYEKEKISSMGYCPYCRRKTYSRGGYFMICKYCKKLMTLDDVDRYKNYKEQYWLCNFCNSSCIVRIRNNKVISEDFDKE